MFNIYEFEKRIKKDDDARSKSVKETSRNKYLSKIRDDLAIKYRHRMGQFIKKVNSIH